MKSPSRRPRLITIAHSYCVTLNRRLAQELARAGDWDVTAVAPAVFRGDFGWHTLEADGREPCAVEAVPTHFSRHVHLMLYGRKVSALLRQPWDLVHCWEEPYIAAAAQIAWATPPQVPLVFATFQNIDKTYPPPFNWIERYTMARADGVIAFGDTVEDTLEARGFGRIPSRVIPPGVDIAHFRPDRARRATTLRDLGWSDGIPVVGFVGRFIHQKGLAMLMGALDRLGTPWRALFVGAGPLESELQAWGRRHGDRVRIASAVRHDDVAAHLNAMDVLCAPSQTTPAWREQFGRMLIEAFACGVPVVASDSGEIPHVVADAGLIVGEHDADGWAHALENLLADPAKRAELSERGRARAASVFAWPVVARQHLEFFDQLIAARRAA